MQLVRRNAIDCYMECFLYIFSVYLVIVQIRQSDCSANNPNVDTYVESSTKYFLLFYFFTLLVYDYHIWYLACLNLLTHKFRTMGYSETQWFPVYHSKLRPKM